MCCFHSSAPLYPLSPVPDVVGTSSSSISGLRVTTGVFVFGGKCLIAGGIIGFLGVFCSETAV